MNMNFWFIAGILAGVSGAIVALALIRGTLARIEFRVIPVSVAIVGVIAFSLIALVLYRTFGSPELVGQHAVAATVGPHPGIGASTGASPDSMENVVTRLEARIAAGGAKREDWLLLAQSYDFLGRPAEAQRARESAANGAAVGAAPVTTNASQPVSAPAESVIEYERRVQTKPSDVDAWQALAGLYRRQHDYAKARAAFAKLVELKAMNADSWADYADTLASTSGGSLRGEAAKAIDAALKLDATHPKALWLKASLAHEERRYADALNVWKRLRAALSPDSSDVRIVDANIAEAAQLAGVPSPVRVTASTPTASSAAAAAPSPTAGGIGEVSGTVSIDGKLAARVPAGAILFIYAKAADSPGPPLAVLRQTTGAWPIAFRLDDTLAMIPSRKLSQFDRVIVEARISRSGQAAPAPGDLYVTSAVLKPGTGKKLALVIDHEVS
jgi:cytochrome c-type biogenesis protein CcmH